MSTAGNEILDFQCPKCGKKLKANRQVAGKRVKCPQCLQPVLVPHDVAKPVSGTVNSAPNQNDDWLNLDLSAEFDGRPASAQGFESRSNPLLVSSSPPKPVSADSPHTKDSTAGSGGGSRSPATKPAVEPTMDQSTPAAHSAAMAQNTKRVSAVSPRPKSSVEQESVPPVKTTAKTSANPPTASEPPAQSLPPRSVFDDDLPDLTSAITDEDTELNLQRTPASLNRPTKKRQEQSQQPTDALGLGAIIGDDMESPPEYRIICKNCGTAQYVRENKKGKKIQCPDCYIEFVVPPPPANWQAPKAKPKASRDDVVDVKLAPVESVAAVEVAEKEKARVGALLERARRELDDEIDELYEPDFDTKGFIERTFGFAMGGLGVLQLVLYGLMFALFFGVIQFSAIEFATGERGYAFLVPIVATSAVLVSLPMLSGGLALIESLANGRKKVLEWPNFNLFENFSDIMLIGSAFVASMSLGLILGGVVGKFFENYMLTLVGILGTTFLLFPIFLLSMLDNGSLFQPLSVSVFRSISGVPEQWGAYYLKTFAAFATIQVAWLILLGRTPVLAGIGGFLLPTLMFFTCQQVGVLAHGIAEHLSFEFVDEASKSK